MGCFLYVPVAFLLLVNINLVFGDECGSKYTSNSGTIQYKLNDTYNKNEYCPWLIFSEGSSLELNLTKYGFNESSQYFDGITILDIDPYTGNLRILERLTTKHGFPVQTVKVMSGHAVVIFISGNYSTGSGFELTFEASGQPTTDVTYVGTVYDSRKGTIDPNQFILYKTYPKTLYQIITMTHSPSRDIETDVAFTSNVYPTTFAKFNGKCDYEEKYKAYELIDGIHLLQLGELPSTQDKKDCPRFIEISARKWFTANTGYWIITRRKHRRNLLSNVHETQEIIRLNQNTCGGLVVGTSGYISCKENEFYDDEENCTWYVKSGIDWPRMHFTLEKEGFELTYDKLEIEKPLNKGAQQMSTRPSKERKTVQELEVIADNHFSGTFVRFTSDASLNGTGFRLSYSTSPLGYV